ncbi:hypothetical protein VCR4J5_1600021 [Vibrio crassostreae]|uniref:Uncharacterized protein n=1 Tax=Vibrio crassostreae TaxID=246167 RepID=A0ABM9QR75_9VIBR|nr:hypothetical protein VCR4J5_1600021 [Vibrio crassostreae]CDT37421.1 hypothetical protein VCR19J5_240021 [Vibrio crassostreae]CDT64002.1 hypothetical protein VCR15J5_770025 [Vibrio crassostreae]
MLFLRGRLSNVGSTTLLLHRRGLPLHKDFMRTYIHCEIERSPSSPFSWPYFLTFYSSSPNTLKTENQ